MNKFKRAGALIIVILWGILILTTVIVAFIDTPFCNSLLGGLMMTDIFLPIIAYAIMLMYRLLKNKRPESVDENEDNSIAGNKSNSQK